MRVIITMAGRGQRFRDAGFDMPKYMIDVLGKSLFEWSLLSLSSFFDSEFIFVCREEDGATDFIRNKCNLLDIAKFEIVQLKETTDGQATTVILSGEGRIRDDESIAIYNIDTFVERNILKPNLLKGDGFVAGFIAEGDKWSFIMLTNEGKVTDIAEKKPISNVGTIGFYYFKSFSLYREYYHKTFANSNSLVNGEKYIAPMYENMIGDELLVTGNIIEADQVWGLGTPEDVNYFLNEYKRS